VGLGVLHALGREQGLECFLGCLLGVKPKYLIGEHRRVIHTFEYRGVLARHREQFECLLTVVHTPPSPLAAHAPQRG
jgi:hypothetical protein